MFFMPCTNIVSMYMYTVLLGHVCAHSGNKVLISTLTT